MNIAEKAKTTPTILLFRWLTWFEKFLIFYGFEISTEAVFGNEQEENEEEHLFDILPKIYLVSLFWCFQPYLSSEKLLEITSKLVPNNRQIFEKSILNGDGHYRSDFNLAIFNKKNFANINNEIIAINKASNLIKNLKNVNITNWLIAVLSCEVDTVEKTTIQKSRGKRGNFGRIFINDKIRVVGDSGSCKKILPVPVTENMQKNQMVIYHQNITANDYITSFLTCFSDKLMASENLINFIKRLIILGFSIYEDNNSMTFHHLLKCLAILEDENPANLLLNIKRYFRMLQSFCGQDSMAIDQLIEENQHNFEYLVKMQKSPNLLVQKTAKSKGAQSRVATAQNNTTFVSNTSMSNNSNHHLFFEDFPENQIENEMLEKIADVENHYVKTVNDQNDKEKQVTHIFNYNLANLKLPPLQIFHKENAHFVNLCKKLFINLQSQRGQSGSGHGKNNKNNNPSAKIKTNITSKVSIIISSAQGMLRREFIKKMADKWLNYVFIDYLNDDEHNLRRIFTIAATREIVLCIRWSRIVSNQQYLEILLKNTDFNQILKIWMKQYSPKAFHYFLNNVFQNINIVILAEEDNDQQIILKKLTKRYFTIPDWTWGDAKNVDSITRELTVPLLVETEEKLPVYVYHEESALDEKGENIVKMEPYDTEVLEKKIQKPSKLDLELSRAETWLSTDFANIVANTENPDDTIFENSKYSLAPSVFRLKSIYKYIKVNSNDYFNNITSLFKITCRLFTRKITSSKLLEINYNLNNLKKSLKLDYDECNLKVNASQKVLDGYVHQKEEVLQPRINEYQKSIEEDKNQLNNLNEMIAKDKITVGKLKDKIDAIHEFYKKILEQANNALPEAAIDELKKYREPPILIKKLIAFLCELLNLEQNDWTYAREKLLSRADLNKDLANINRDKIPRSLLRKLELFCVDNYVAAEIEAYQLVYQNSKAAALVYVWLQGIVAFCDVRKRTKKFRQRISHLKIRIQKKTKKCEEISKQIENTSEKLADNQDLLHKIEDLIANHTEDCRHAKLTFDQKNNRLKAISSALDSLIILYPDLHSEKILKNCVQMVQNLFHKKEIDCVDFDEDTIYLLKHFVELMRVPVVILDKFGAIKMSPILSKLLQSLENVHFLKETEEWPSSKNQAGIYVAENDNFSQEKDSVAHVVNITNSNYLSIFQNIENSENPSYLKELRNSKMELDSAVKQLQQCLGNLTTLDKDDDHDLENFDARPSEKSLPKSYNNEEKFDNVDKFLNFDSQELIEIVRNTTNRYKMMSDLPLKKWRTCKSFIANLFTKNVNPILFSKITGVLVKTTSIYDLDFEQRLRSEHLLMMLKSIFMEKFNYLPSLYSDTSVANLWQISPIILIDEKYDDQNQRNLNQNYDYNYNYQIRENLNNLIEISCMSKKFESSLIACLRDGKSVKIRECLDEKSVFRIAQIYENFVVSGKKKVGSSTVFIRLDANITYPNLSFVVDLRSKTDENSELIKTISTSEISTLPGRCNLNQFLRSSKNTSFILNKIIQKFAGIKRSNKAVDRMLEFDVIYDRNEEFVDKRLKIVEIDDENRPVSSETICYLFDSYQAFEKIQVESSEYFEKETDKVDSNLKLSEVVLKQINFR